MLLNIFLALGVATGFFFLGVWFSDRYHHESDIRTKEALERQYLRLQAGMDADDPCRPYIAPRQRTSRHTSAFTSELLAEFGKKMKETGQASVFLHK